VISLLFYTQIEAKRPIRATRDQVGRGSTRRRIHHHGERVDLDGADRLREDGFFLDPLYAAIRFLPTPSGSLGLTPEEGFYDPTDANAAF